MKIAVFGTGYVGLVSGTCMAELGNDVVCVDIDEAKIEGLKKGEMPIYEPGLDELVKQSRGKNLFFSTDVAGGIADNDIIFVSVNTPTKTFGQGAGRAADLQYWEKTAREILANSTSDKIVVEKSTLPVRTAAAMERILSSGGGSVHFEVLSNPEFLAEGSAMDDLNPRLT